MTRILCLTTGGTIASAEAADGGLAIAVAGADVVGAAGDVEVVEVARASSTTLGLAQVHGWGLLLAERLAETSLAGAVVTVGTDTLEEVAYLLSLTVGGTKPVVVTGAMLPPGVEGADGPANVRAALAVARDPAARGRCALVAFAGAVHAATAVVKVHATAVDAFASPAPGPVGVVDADGGYRPLRLAPPRETIPATRIDERVAFARALLGAGGEAIDAAIAGGAPGLVLETLPSGGVPPGMAAAVERALAAGLVVVAASRTPGGPTRDYRGFGEGRWLADIGVHLLPDLSAAKARIRLALALALDDPAARTRLLA